MSLRGYYNPKKTDLIALLSEQSTKEMPATPPGTKRYKRMPLHPVKIMIFLAAVAMTAKFSPKERKMWIRTIDRKLLQLGRVPDHFKMKCGDI